MRADALMLTHMSKDICLALSVALLTTIALPSRSHESKSPPAHLAPGHHAIYLVASAEAGLKAASETGATVIDGGEGNTTLRAQGDVVAMGAQIKAQQDVLIQGANVRVEAVKDSAFSHEEEHRKGYDHALIQRQETLSGGEISAGRNLSIVANGSRTSRAGISGVAGDSQARTGDAETGIKPIFDKNRVSEEVNAQITITREFGKQGSTAWGNYATQQYATALQKGDAEGAECWGPSGTCRAVGHALIGGATGGVGGAVGAGVTSMTAPQAQALLRGSGLPEPMVQALVQGYGMGIGGAVGGTSGAAAGTNEAAHNTAAFATRLVVAGGGLVLATCFAMPVCAKDVGPALISAVQDLQRAGDAVDETMLRGCRLSPLCMTTAVAMGVDVFGTAPGKPVTPEQGPNHTGGNQTENPTPGGSSTAKPNEGPRGENNTGGNQIADQKPGTNNTVSPIAEPQGPGLVFASPITPVPNPVVAGNGLSYGSNDKHTPGAPGSGRNQGVEPRNSLDLFNDSIPSFKDPDGVRYTKDSNGDVHRFSNDGNGNWHWSGSTGDANVPLNRNNIPPRNFRQPTSDKAPVYTNRGVR